MILTSDMLISYVKTFSTYLNKSLTIKFIDMSPISLLKNNNT